MGLKKAIGGARLTFEELLTVITEIETIINCRTLSFVTNTDWEDPLTRSHLINRYRLMDVSIGTLSNVFDDRMMAGISKREATNRLKLLREAVSHFWRRWKWEYLLELRNHHSQTIRQSGSREIANGDVVIMEDEKEK